MLTNACGFMSMVLDNVTCVLLTGPLTYQIAKKMELNPRAIYLAMTICATIGGTGTLIGDPPNIVIGMKLKIGFEKFFIVNLPIVAFVLLPVASGMLYYRFKDTLITSVGARPVLDMKALASENRIKDEPMLAKLCAVLGAVLLGFLLSPIHKIEPSWLTVMAMFACALSFDHHHMGRWLELVEWDTLFFFALLFVLVESLSELGVIRTLGLAIMNFINVFPVDIRMNMAVTIILWVSGIGSAFLESLPYTATMVYIIQDLMQQDVEGVHVDRLVWPLSIGACVGGIGSIMGSSANLVCMAISNRNADKEEDKVQGSDFLKYGLPTLIVLLAISNVWLLFMLVWLDIAP
jgi:Na+/H+ antiporter NhaD/arsenite permease-like protein